MPPSVAAGSGKLRTDYRPSQPTGWETPYTPTIGGHVSSKYLEYEGKRYELSLLSYAQADESPNPVYEPAPTDPAVKFKRTLGNNWNRYYQFRYMNGLPKGAWFTAEAYGVQGGNGVGFTTREPASRHSDSSTALTSTPFTTRVTSPMSRRSTATCSSSKWSGTPVKQRASSTA